MSPARALVASCLLTTFVLAQTTHLVPAQFPTIQQAVDAAVAGDTVLVDPGDYIENVLIDKAVVVKSLVGASQTFITYDASASQGRTEVGGGGELHGFTVRLGFGMTVKAPGVLRGCVVEEHSDTGLKMVGNSLLFPGDDIVVVADCTIRNNEGKDGTIGSTTNLGGVGGVDAHGVRLYIVNSVIAWNVGGESVPSSLQFWWNVPPGPAGGLFVDGGCEVYGCTIAFNRRGAGDVVPPMTAEDVGVRNPEFVRISSSIVWNDSFFPSVTYGSSSCPHGGCGFVDASYSNIRGRGGDGFMCIDADPLFLSPQSGDFRLFPGSPCFDAGMPGFLYDGFYSADIAGRPRVIGGRMDMGAHEFVDPLSGTADGLMLRTTVAGRGAGLEAKVALPGQDLVAELSDGFGALGGAVPVILGQLFLTGTPPVGLPAGSYYLDPAQTAVLYDGNAQAGPLVGSTPIIFGPEPAPPGLSGLVLRLQGFGLTPLAANGFYAATDAIDHHFLD